MIKTKDFLCAVLMTNHFFNEKKNKKIKNFQGTFKRQQRFLPDQEQVTADI